MIFKELRSEIQQALIDQKISTPTPIQKKSIPIILEGKDLIGIAQTGTGKTASFVLPILNILADNKTTTQPMQPSVLVLSPTRELAVQIDTEFETFGKDLDIKHEVVFGGMSSKYQVEEISKGIHILTATPGRLQDLISKEQVDLSKVEYIVLDEAHMMLDMGFLPVVKEIYALLSKERQSLFFSATITKEIKEFAYELLKKPKVVEIEQPKEENPIIERLFYMYVERKNATLLRYVKPKTIVFLRTKYKTDAVADLLNKHNKSAVAIHSDKTQEERSQAIEDFKTGKAKILVATDVAARGIHIDSVACVINYDTPNSPPVYVHRIGRTARAGKSGKAYTFCSREEREYLRKIEEHTGRKMEVVHHEFHVSKIEKMTPEDSAAEPAKKPRYHRQKQVGKRNSTSKTEGYVPPINQKKAKKPRGLHRGKQDRRR